MLLDNAAIVRITVSVDRHSKLIDNSENQFGRTINHFTCVNSIIVYSNSCKKLIKAFAKWSRSNLINLSRLVLRLVQHTIRNDKSFCCEFMIHFNIESWIVLKWDNDDYDQGSWNFSISYKSRSYVKYFGQNNLNFSEDFALTIRVQKHAFSLESDKFDNLAKQLVCVTSRLR